MPNPALLRLLSACVFLSGGVALILEAVYQKYLATLIGATTPASTVVLAIYFVGLTLGALVAPKSTHRANVRLALLELFIAGWSVGLSLFFYRSYEALASLLAAASRGPVALALARVAIAGVWILPPTMAMGAHLPTLAAVLESRGLSTGRALTRLYAINLAGAFSFTLATPFLFFYQLGLRGTLLGSAAIGLCVAAALFIGLREASAPAAETAAPSPNPAAPSSSASTPRWPFALALLSGFVFFALEALWSHLIASVLGASTYSFSILLGVVLLSLALAGRQVERAAPRDLAQVKGFLRSTLASLALGVPLTMLLWPFAGRALAVIGGTVLRLESFWGGELLKFAVAYLLIKPVAAGVGTLFPLTFHGLSAGHAPSSRQLGWIYALNAVGCAVGALLTGFGFIPLLGAELTFKVLWVVLLATWALLTFDRVEPVPPRAWVTVMVGIGLAVLSPPWNKLELTSGYGVNFRGHILPGSELVYFAEDQHVGFTTVVDQPQPNGFLGSDVTRFLYTNGKFEADDATQMPAQCAFGLYPSLFAKRTDRAFIIGFGGGQTTGTTRAAGYRQVDVCEISPSAAQAAARHFAHINRSVLDQPGVRLILEDGRNYLLRTSEKYDLISIEITSIWFAGAANLYSTEFYRLAKKHLSHGGILEQWVQMHHLTLTEIATVLATLADQFAYVEMWLGGEQAVLLASEEPLRLNPVAWERFRTSPELEGERRVFDKLVGSSSLESFWNMRVLTRDQVLEVIRRTPHAINTDENKWIEFHSPRYYLSKRDHVVENFNALRAIAQSVPSDGATDRPTRRAAPLSADGPEAP
jgi:spermidine synthase